MDLKEKLEGSGHVVVKPVRGRPKNSHKVGVALDLVKTELQKVNEVYEKMSDVQRRLFVSSLKGYPDELKTMLDAKYYDGIRSIVKVVYTKKLGPKGNPVPITTDKVTLENVDELDEASYQRLLRVAKCSVKHLLGDRQYQDYIVDIKGLFKLVAPEAMSALVEVSTDKKAKTSDRIRAANSLLDRAGYGSDKDSSKNNTPPVLVQINFDKKPQAELNPISVVQPEDYNG